MLAEEVIVNWHQKHVKHSLKTATPMRSLSLKRLPKD